MTKNLHFITNQGYKVPPLAQSQIRGHCPMSGVRQKSYRATNFGHRTSDTGHWTPETGRLA